jgi:hypothetical protein
MRPPHFRAEPKKAPNQTDIIRLTPGAEVSPDALEGGSREALANGTCDHENEGHQVDILSTSVVTADSEGHLLMLHRCKDRTIDRAALCTHSTDVCTA